MFKAIDKILSVDPFILRTLTATDLEAAASELAAMGVLLNILMSQAPRGQLETQMGQIRSEATRLANEMKTRSEWYPDLTPRSAAYTNEVRAFLEALLLTSPSDLEPLKAIRGLAVLKELDDACTSRATAIAMSRGTMANASFDFAARQAGAHPKPKDVQ